MFALYLLCTRHVEHLRVYLKCLLLICPSFGLYHVQLQMSSVVAIIYAGMVWNWTLRGGILKQKVLKQISVKEM